MAKQKLHRRRFYQKTLLNHGKDSKNQRDVWYFSFNGQKNDRFSASATVREMPRYELQVRYNCKDKSGNLAAFSDDSVFFDKKRSVDKALRQLGFKRAEKPVSRVFTFDDSLKDGSVYFSKKGSFVSGGKNKPDKRRGRWKRANR